MSYLTPLKTGVIAAGAGSAAPATVAATWDTVNSNAAYAFSNSDLDASKTSGDSSWGDAAVISAVDLDSTNKYEIDLELEVKSSHYENFGVNLKANAGNVAGGGYLSQNTSGSYGAQPEGSLSPGDVVTLRWNGPSLELTVLINGATFGSTLSPASGTYWFVTNNYKTGSTVRIREEVYPPASGFTKIVAP